MNADRNTVLGLLLVGAILLFTYTDFYKKWVFGDNYDNPPAQTTEDVNFSGIEPETIAPTKETVVEKNQVFSNSSHPGFSEKFSNQADSTEKIITVDTELYTAKISSRGPSIISWVLKEYQNKYDVNLELIDGTQGNLSISVPFKGDTLHFNDYNLTYLSSTQKFDLQSTSEIALVPFRFKFDDNSYVDVTFKFSSNDYSFEYDIKFVGTERIIDGFKYSVNWLGGIASTENSLKEDMQYCKAWALTADNIEEFDVSSDESLLEFKNDWTIRWSAIRNKYFATALIPLDEESNGIKVFGKTQNIGAEGLFKSYGYELFMPVKRGNFENKFLGYIGPLEYSVIKSYGHDLDKMMNFGWSFIRPISKGVLWTLKKLYIVIPNYGWVIVIFSIFIKILLFPLTKKSYQSMKEMQVLQPEMTELREKHKDNPQKLNQAMMELYKEHGVNPLGGCLPMVLQMPVLFGLFVIFRTTIELRGAPFIFWITDLSAPDTVFTLPFTLPMYGNGFNILPLLMGITMFFQQKATVTDPKQKMMVYMMPVLFTFMFNAFPSGLTLYYTLFNTFSMLQQKYMPVKPKERNVNKSSDKKAKPKGKLDFYRQQAKLRKKQ